MLNSRLQRWALTAAFVFVVLVSAGCIESSSTTSTGADDQTATTGQETTTTGSETTTTGPGTPTTTAGGDGKATVQRVCSQCHGLRTSDGTEITPAGQGKVAGFESMKGIFQTATPRDWEATVVRMKDQNKCPMSDDEAKTIIKYLNETIK